jgi:hypothetical protein
MESCSITQGSGLVHALLRLPTLEDILGHPVAGGSWEGFVIESLLAVAPAGTEASFYRSSAGAEIDLLLALPGRELWAIEIRRNAAPSWSVVSTTPVPTSARPIASSFMAAASATR